ncbi:hypothetical protein HRbin06_00903 [archaeon HR06]|nr:hypothetical protein HRbin06_00903 [archaeon HR06]
MDLNELVKAIIALVIVVDPLGLVPVYLSLTKDKKEKERRSILKTAVLTSILLLILFALAGQQILAIFGISLPSFMIAGGILLLLLSFEMLLGLGLTERLVSSEEVGVVPLAFPLLVGPGAITTTIVILQTSGILITLISVIIVMLLSWLIFSFVDKIYRILGSLGSLIVSKIMAIFIAAIAIQFIISGLQYYYPAR